MSEASAKRCSAALPPGVQVQPPVRISGRLAPASMAMPLSRAAGRGAGSAISDAPDRGAVSERVVSISSGNAMTTGPGRPVVAVFQARARISGMRSTRSIWTAHFAMLPKTAG